MNNVITGKVSNQTKWSFGLGGFGKDFGLVLVNIFIMIYYTDVAGLSPIFLAGMFLLARVWDTINDPILGYIVAKTNTRWGKYKPWILVGNVLNAVFLVGIFAAHLFEGNAQLWWVVFTYVGWGMTYTMLDAPFWSLVPKITLNKDEREGLMPYPRVFATAASYTVQGVAVYAVMFFGAGDDGRGYMLFAVCAGVLAIISALITCKWVEESFEEDEAASKNFNLKQAFSLILKNKQFLWLLAIALCYNVGTALMGGYTLYFYTYVLGDATKLAVASACGGIAGVGTLLFFKPIVKAVGRQALFSASLVFPVLAAVSLWFAGNYAPESNLLIGLSGVFGGVSGAVYWLIILIMVADTVDYGDKTIGIRAESVSYSAHTLISKCSGALTGSLIGLGLAAINFVPNEVQTTEALTGLQFLYLSPAVLCALGFFIYSKFYKLNGKNLDKLQDDLRAKYA